MDPGLSPEVCGTAWSPGPVWGCVLIGGGSTRMGRPKHLLRQGDTTWLELIVHAFRGHVDRVVLAGGGEVPPSLATLARIADVPGVQGPLAGLLAAFRFQPQVSWLVAACDLPHLEGDSLAWLLRFRGPEVRAVLPDLQGDGLLEPLLAYYDRSCRSFLEELAAGGQRRLSGLAGRPGILTPRPPAHLQGSWRNLNRPEDLAGL